MGKKWGWFYAVKKAFSPTDPTKVVDRKDSRSRKSKRKWFGRYNSSTSSSSEHVSSSEQENKLSPPCVYHDVQVELEDDNSIIDKDNPNHNGHTYTVALATAAAAAQAAAEAVWLSVTRFSGKSKEDTAAIRIQSTFRGYTARKVFRTMKRLARLKKLVQGHYVNKQASTTLRCMQTLARVQSQIRSRRIRMSEENQVLHKQRQQKRDRDNVGDSWNASPRSKEQMEARLQRRQEASLRRERALAYAFSHQKALRNKFLNPLMEPNSSIWGWSWLERWMATRPWDSIQNNNSSNNDIDKQSGSGMIKKTSTTTTSSNPKRPTTIKKYHSLSCAPSLVSWGKGNKVVNEEEEETSSSKQHKNRIRRHSITGFTMRRASSSASIDMEYDKPVAAPASTRKTRSRPASPLSSSTSSLKHPNSFLPSPVTSRRHSAFPTGTSF